MFEFGECLLLPLSVCVLPVKFSFNVGEPGYSIQGAYILDFSHLYDHFLLTVLMNSELLPERGNFSVEVIDFGLNIFSLIDLVYLFYHAWIDVFLYCLIKVVLNSMFILVNVDISGFEVFRVFPEIWVHILSFGGIS